MHPNPHHPELTLSQPGGGGRLHMCGRVQIMLDRSKLDLYGLFFIVWTCPKSYMYLGSTRLIGPKGFCSASPALALNCVIIFWTKIGMLNESTLDFFQSNPYFLPNLPRLLAATFNLTTFLHIYEYLMSNELLISCRLTWISAEKHCVIIFGTLRKQSMSGFLRDFLPLI